MNVMLVSLVQIVCSSGSDDEHDYCDQIDCAYGKCIQRLILLDLDPRWVDFEICATELEIIQHQMINEAINDGRNVIAWASIRNAYAISNVLNQTIHIRLLNLLANDKIDKKIEEEIITRVE